MIHRVRMVLTDVDGVLTDGKIHLGPDGREGKVFHVQDGIGFALLRLAGIKTGMITGRECEAVKRRAEEMRVDELYQKCYNKPAAMAEILGRHGIASEEVAYLGDDIQDLPLLERVGLPVAVADAHPRVRARATIVTRAKGGEAAFRELAERVLESQGKLEEVLQRFNSRQVV